MFEAGPWFVYGVSGFRSYEHPVFAAVPEVEVAGKYGRRSRRGKVVILLCGPELRLEPKPRAAEGNLSRHKVGGGFFFGKTDDPVTSRHPAPFVRRLTASIANSMPHEANVVNRYKQTSYGTVPPIVEGDPLSPEGDGGGPSRPPRDHFRLTDDVVRR